MLRASVLLPSPVVLRASVLVVPVVSFSILRASVLLLPLVFYSVGVVEKHFFFSYGDFELTRCYCHAFF
jgi:hypothetical protein